MNLTELHGKLIAAARATPPDERVPYTFEKRIMARLAGKTPLDAWELWGRALSRAAAFCVVFMLVLSAGSFFLPPAAPTDPSLSQDLEQTLFAAVDNGNADQQDAR
jgi:hypothetical protein